MLGTERLEFFFVFIVSRIQPPSLIITAAPANICWGLMTSFPQMTSLYPHNSVRWKLLSSPLCTDEKVEAPDHFIFKNCDKVGRPKGDWISCPLPVEVT